ncbi:hypothetical protein [uncultured Bacteroides sp.]|nr:hypothetical protein [uncultured Bacteroides sp.]
MEEACAATVVRPLAVLSGASVRRLLVYVYSCMRWAVIGYTRFYLWT